MLANKDTVQWHPTACIFSAHLIIPGFDTTEDLRPGWMSDLQYEKVDLKL